MRLQLWDRNGTTLLGLLPDVISYQASFEFSDVGALQFDYPTDGINASLITDLREVSFVSDNGSEVANGRFVITNISRDRAYKDDTLKVTCKSILWRLDTALVYPDGGINSGEVSRFFDTAFPGKILKDCIDDAQTRGALAGLTYTFTATKDSNNQNWVDSFTQEYPARTTILSVLRGLYDLGLVEVQTNARVLKATLVDGIGSDKTAGLAPVVLRHGYNLTEAPEQRAADKIAGAVLVEGDQGLLVERTNSTAISTFGRLETSMTASGIDDPVVVQEVGDSYLANAGTTSRQLTVGLTLQDGAPQPMTDFIPGDYVYTATTAGLERVRVRQITISMSGGSVSATATLGDRIYENDIRASRKLSAITSGSVTAGAGTLPVTTPTIVPDTIAPAAPSSLTGTTTAYLDGSNPRARVVLSWTAPTTNTDGSALTDLRGYNVFIRRAAGDAWEFAGSVTGTSATLSGLTPGQSYRYSVRAVDASGNQSALATEFVQTAAVASGVAFAMTPSTPTLTTRLGTITVQWDGLTSTAGSPPVNFARMEVHVSTTNNFTPSSSTFKGNMTAGVFVLADLAYSTTYYIKLVPVSTSGVSGTASAQATGSVQRLVDADVIANTISGSKIVDGSITASDKIVANTITGGLIQALAISADKIQANAITADKIAAGSIDATKISATYVYAGAINASQITAGTITASVSFNAASGTFTGTVNASSGSIGGFSIGSTFLSGTGFRINSDSGSCSFGAVTAASVNATGGLTIGGTVSAGGNAFNNVGTYTGSSITLSGNMSAGSGTVTGNQLVSNSAASATTTAATNCYISTGGQIQKTSTTSSLRYKENITDIKNVPGLDPKALLDLPVVGFTYKQGHIPDTDDRAGVMLPGFIAEDVDRLYPIAADYEDGNVETWNERFIVPALLSLIQDLAKKVDSLEQRLDEGKA